MGRKPRRTQPASAEAKRGSRLPLSRYSLALAAAGIAAYLNSLDAPFVFDDMDAIVANRHVVALWPLRDAMSAPVQSAVAGRPIVSLTLALSCAWNGFSPAAFRVFNLAVLVASGLALFGILRRAFRRVAGEAPGTSDWIAFAASLVWIVHPLQTEVVDYITQRTESLMGLFYLLTLYASIRVMAGNPDRDCGRRLPSWPARSAWAARSRWSPLQ